LFQADLMFPVVTNVVLVDKPFPKSKVEARQTDSAGHFVENRSADVVRAEILAVDPKTVEMGVAPVKGYLECIVKVSDCLIGVNQKSAPDERAHTVQQGMELINFRHLHDAEHPIKALNRFQPPFALVSVATRLINPKSIWSPGTHPE
jgi:hypothetical protein